MNPGGPPQRISSDPIHVALICALAITGGIATVVFAFPTLVLVGLYLLVIPGLLLGSTPTLFLYLLIFSAVWFTIGRRIHSALAAAAGVAAVVWFAVGLPAMLNQRTAAYDAEAAAFDHEPSSKIGAARTVALQSPDNSAISPTCGPLCQILLYNGIAERVIVSYSGGTPKRPVPAASYRIERQSSCPDPGKTLADSDSWIGLGKHAAAVRVRIAAGECMVAEPADDMPADLLIRRIDQTVGPNTHLSLQAAGVQVKTLQLEAGGHVVARGSRRTPNYLRVPLRLEPVGSAERFTGWEWARHGDRYQQQFDIAAMLRRFTSFNLDVPRGADPKELRERIDSALDDPTLDPKTAGLALVHDYFTSISVEGALPSDTRRIARLIADRRMTKFWYIPVHKIKHDADRLILYDAILDRLPQLAATEEWEGFRGLADALDAMPKDAFSRPDPRVDELLADRDLRRVMPGLIKRLAERGPAAAGTLASIAIGSYAAQPSKRKGPRGYQSEEYPAALEGLCRLGTGAAPVLPLLRQAAASRAIPAGALESDYWRSALIALGASATEFDLPSGRKESVDHYRERLEKFARNQCKGS